MKKIALVLSLYLPACSWFSSTVKATEDKAIACATAEEAIATKGTDVVTLAIEIAGQFAMAVVDGTLNSTLTSLFTQYGEPFVACVLHNIAPSAGTGSAAPATASDDPVTAAARQVIETKGWTFK